VRRIVVVGASLAGLRAAEELRGQGFDGELVVVGDEPHRPYDRPPLSKQVLAGTWDADHLPLAVAHEGGLDGLDVDWRLGTRATGLDLATRTITLADDDVGVELAFDGLVIATGASPRWLPGCRTDLAAVHTLRTLDDSLAIRAVLDTTPQRVVVVGGGFIGAEVAATCRSRGVDVTLVEMLPVPMGVAVGDEVGTLMADIHRDHGVDVRLGVGVERVDGSDRVERVRLTDGTVLSAALVVIGIGVVPNTAWLDGSGLTVDDGIVCDATGQATSGVFAAGDVARWPSRRYGRSLRIEHWDNAIAMGEHVAQRLLAGSGGSAGSGDDGDVYDPVPWFWSDQYDRKVQLAGVAAGADEMQVVEGSMDERRFVALYRQGDRLAAVLAMNRPRPVVTYRRQIQAGASWSDALATASG
jgi:3-phenylpropionate/trans-cinnamate dioxygenase ferredoxin reductase component